MTIESVSNSDIQYYLISFDKHGNERTDDPDATDGILSNVLKDELANKPITDVFFMSHGWKGNVPAAKEQYNSWTGAMLDCQADRDKIRQMRLGFRPLLVGLHWPSLPWGDESLDTSPAAFATGENPMEAWVEDAADKLADSERAKTALRTIFTAALDDISPPTLPAEVVDAYRVLQEEAGLLADGPAAAPGADAEAFDPEQLYQAELSDAAAFGGMPGVGGLLSVLQQLSFWKMKDRPRTFGESGAATLLRELQEIAAPKDVRFHLMGHSFGCIAVSATVAGTGGDTALVKPIDSLFLVQGALSIWAYCSDIPVAQGKSGYFNSIINGEKVSGPIVTTQSEYDTAVGRHYPLAAGLKRQVVFAPDTPPKYGALGSFGARGPGVSIEDTKMLPIDGTYGYVGGKTYNPESSHIICEGEGPSGAHSDIAKPEVAHAFWEAVMTSSQ